MSENSLQNTLVCKPWQHANLVCWLIVLVFFCLHLAYINTPFINLEWAYRQGSQLFLTGSEQSLNDYFQYQANPLTYSYLSSWVVKLTGMDVYASYRLFALGGGTLLLVWLARFGNPWLLIIIGLNPLIWIYSGRAYSELLSVSLMVVAYDIHQRYYLKSILGGFAGMVKYHAWPVLLLYLGFSWLAEVFNSRFRDWHRNRLFEIIFIIALVILFLLLYRKATGFWLYPDHFRSVMVTFSFQNWLNNIFSYGFYLSGMFFLTIPALVNRNAWKLKLLLFVISLWIAINNQNLGEMDFGSFEQLLGNEIIILIKAVSFWNFCCCCYLFFQSRESRVLILTIIFYIIILSLTRPAQRYLIFIIPFWAMLVCGTISLQRFLWVGYAFTLVVLNLFATLYQINNARASSRMADWAKENNLIIDFGVIHPHIGNNSRHDPSSPYKVVIGSSGSEVIVHEEEVAVLGKRIRIYNLVNRDSQ